ncbi:MAG: CDP-glycerol glycerophosphotransferase family protein [Spirochaetales bacterium]|nr:CDP-glycerol glycerophosphotransferase family protein [Spirochaetales bacterium]
MYSLSYIDPGTGSMIFSLFIGIAAAASFALNALWVKLKFVFSGGKIKNSENDNTIPYIIYSDHKQYWNIFHSICDEFEKRQIPLVYWTAYSDDPVLSADYKFVKAEFIGEGNKGFAKLNFLKADILLATTPGLDVYQWKRSKNVKWYVHIPHTLDELSGYRMFGLDYYDAIVCSGENQVRWVKKVESMRDITPKELVVCGSPHHDEMFAKKQAQSNNNKNEVPVILVAPSWGKSAILSRFGKRFIQAVLDIGYKVIVRPHPQSTVVEKGLLQELSSAFSDNPNLTWNYDNDNFDVLSQSDLLITDFSGVILDYTMIFGKPCIYADTNFDPSPYDVYWSDDIRWSIKILPDIGCPLKESDFDNMKNRIDEVLMSKSLQYGIEKIRTDCWANIGTSAQKITDYLINKHNTLIDSNLQEKQEINKE